MAQPTDTQRILHAASFAAKAHAGQRRKGATAEPYINHPLEVASLVADAGADADTIMAALLHDTVEDTDVTEADLAREFGSRVASLVMEVTDDKALPKAERKRLQIVHASHKSVGAAQIKIADKTSNLRAVLASPPVDWDAERQAEYFRWAEQVVGNLPSPNPHLLALFQQTIGAFRATARS